MDLPSLHSDARDILNRLSASNEGQHGLPDKLALLERRLVPSSPAVSRDNGGGSMLLNQNSVHSVTQQPRGPSRREGTPCISNTQLQGVGRSLDGQEANSEQPSKRRRVQAVGEAGRAGSKAAAPQADGRGVSPPAAQQRPSLSPFLSEGLGGAAPKQQPTPTSSKKQKNTISRYFPQISGGAGGVVGGGDLATAAKKGAGSPGLSDQQAAPAVTALMQNLQLEAQRLR